MSFWKEYGRWREGLQEMIRRVDKAAQIQGEGDKKLLFTTFQLDATLFEEHVLSFLAETSGSLASHSRQAAVNGWLKKVRTTVLYDRDGLASGAEKRTSLMTAPIALQKGVFHPKLVLYANGSELGLMVGSANLTRSGIGKNRESCYILASEESTLIRGQELRGELANFLEYLLDEGCIKEDQCRSVYLEIKKWIRTIRSTYLDKAAAGMEKTSFVWSGPGRRSGTFETLMDRIRRAMDLYCWAPYFPADEKEFNEKNIPLPILMMQKKAKENEWVWFFPAAGRDPKKRTLSRSFYEYCEKNLHPKIWKKFKAFEEKDDRFAHLKLMKIVTTSRTVLVAGSHNMTVAAWGSESADPVNIEASLVIPFQQNECEEHAVGDQDVRPLEFDFNVENETEDDLQQERMPEIFVTVDWEESELLIHFPIGPTAKAETEWELKLPCEFGPLRSKRMSISPGSFPNEKNVDLTPLLSDLVFSLTRISDGHTWRGLITERNEIRKPLDQRNLDEFLESMLSGRLFPEERPEERDDQDEITSLGAIGSSVPALQGTTNDGSLVSFSIWFDLFRSFRKLKQASEQHPELIDASIELFRKRVLGQEFASISDVKVLLRHRLMLEEFYQLAQRPKQSERLVDCSSLLNAKIEGFCGSTISMKKMGDWISTVYQRAKIWESRNSSDPKSGED